MESISIAPVSIHDLIKLQTISRSTFAQTFDEHNNVENDMYKYEEVNNRRKHLKIKYERT